MDKALAQLKANGYRVLVTLDNGEAIEGKVHSVDPYWLTLVEATVIGPTGARVQADGTQFLPLAKIARLQVP